MPENRTPSFEDFTRWVATLGRVTSVAAPSARLLAGATSARAASLQEGTLQAGRREVLLLLAAATDDASVPPEMTTARGFRVSIVYGEGLAGGASLCVLVQCPDGLAPYLLGRTACLWSGDRRFELGQFDADGRAIGTLPAGIEITVSDLKRGAVQLEETEPPEEP
jgi:hypothetical protein